jgi:hypothetical protein
VQIALGIVAFLLGSFFVVGQLISAVNFSFAQKLGLQEKDDETEPLFRRLELNTARWDLVVLWSATLAGALMLVDNSWWPYVALIAGGIYVEASGREAAKHLGLRAQGVRIGGAPEVRVYFATLGVMAAVGLGLIAYALADLA